MTYSDDQCSWPVMASNDGPSAFPQDGPSTSPQQCWPLSFPTGAPAERNPRGDATSRRHACAHDGALPHFPTGAPAERNPREDATSRRHACAHDGALPHFPTQERLLHETLEKTHAAAAARAAAREAAFKSQLPDQTAHELSVSERSLAAAQVRDTDGR